MANKEPLTIADIRAVASRFRQMAEDYEAVAKSMEDKGLDEIEAAVQTLVDATMKRVDGNINTLIRIVRETLANRAKIRKVDAKRQSAVANTNQRRGKKPVKQQPEKP